MKDYASNLMMIRDAEAVAAKKAREQAMRSMKPTTTLGDKQAMIMAAKGKERAVFSF